MNVFVQLSLNEVRQVKTLLPYFNATKTSFYAENAYGLRERARKPWWLPRAKTKMFKVPPRPVIPIDDYEELKRLNNIYRTQFKTIQQFFVKELEQERQTLADATSEVSIKEELQDFQRCMEENDKWNADVAKTREIRLKIKDEERQKKIEEIIKRRDERNAALIAEAEEQIKKWKEVKFISRDDLDAAIEKALNTKVDYNFALDLDGNIHHGREGGPSIEEERKELSG